MKKPTISIGIPAYNEQANIGELLTDILRQDTKGINVHEIVVVSDGSTDKTNSIVRAVKNNKVKLIIHSKRTGLASRENEIFQHSQSDILLLLNADIRILDKNFLHFITKPIIKSAADLVSCRTVETSPHGLFEKIIFISSQVKTRLYESLKNGVNVYTCHGQARAFSKNFYKKFSFPFSIGEDAFSYFYCITNNYKYAYTNKTNVFYQLPSNYMDHRRQSTRFLDSKKLLKKHFGSKVINEEYKISLYSYFIQFIKSFILAPVETSIFIALFSYISFISLLGMHSKDAWSMSKSSKRVVI